MHDIDRTQLEFESYADEFEAPQPYAFQRESAVFDEAEEMELASELLAVGDEAELDQFLGDLIGKAGQAIGKAVKGPIGRKLGGFLKGAVKKVVPAAAGVLGTVVGGPLGGAVANKVASAAGDMFGLELEGLSPEDQEFEAARHFVRFAGEAARQAGKIANAADPQAAARHAVTNAAKKLAPGLLRGVSQSLQSETAPMRRSANTGSGQSGRWVREGHRIVLLGA